MRTSKTMTMIPNRISTAVDFLPRRFG
jgi:hypothetical protein